MWQSIEKCFFASVILPEHEPACPSNGLDLSIAAKCSIEVDLKGNISSTNLQMV